RCRGRQGPFVPIHTGAIPKELVASELFGHEKGAFTGALSSQEGKFEAAAGGTVFLDEVGTMDLSTQISLLRVLETYRFTRVGANKERDADVRIIAATNRDLLDLVEANQFREDLIIDSTSSPSPFLRCASAPKTSSPSPSAFSASSPSATARRRAVSPTKRWSACSGTAG